jgi:hypothetical protein
LHRLGISTDGSIQRVQGDAHQDPPEHFGEELWEQNNENRGNNGDTSRYQYSKYDVSGYTCCW